MNIEWKTTWITIFWSKKKPRNRLMRRKSIYLSLMHSQELHQVLIHILFFHSNWWSLESFAVLSTFSIIWLRSIKLVEWKDIRTCMKSNIITDLFWHRIEIVNSLSFLKHNQSPYFLNISVGWVLQTLYIGINVLSFTYRLTYNIISLVQGYLFFLLLWKPPFSIRKTI